MTSAYFTVVDPDGHTVEFAQYSPGSWTIRDVGLHLPATRISEHMSHAGVSVRHLDAALRFYGDVLGCVVVRRGSGNGPVSYTHLSWKRTSPRRPRGSVRSGRVCTASRKEASASRNFPSPHCTLPRRVRMSAR